MSQRGPMSVAQPLANRLKDGGLKLDVGGALASTIVSNVHLA